jgi:CBS domain containing-hemolysin-like protein
VANNRKQTLPAPASTAKLERGLFGKRKLKGDPKAEQIKQIVLDNVSAFSEIDARMLQGIFALSKTTAREIMIPLSEMVAVHVATPIEQAKAMVQHASYQYVPIYDERIDRLTGIVSIMDFLYAPVGTNKLDSFIRPAYYVPETKLAGDLLEELRLATEPVTVVIDEHGSCVGFVGLEDLFEQIVGEIRYSHKRQPLHVEALGNNSWTLDARTPIDIVNITLGTNIPKDDYDTIGGFMLKTIGRLPEQGEKVAYDTIEYIVDEVFDYGITVIHANRRVSQISDSDRSG